MGLFNRKQTLLSSGALKGATDRHSHILYGVDDGVRDLATSLEILSYLENAGLSDLWLTPHVMEEVPNTTEGLRHRFDELCKAYTGPIKLHLAAEYMMDTLFFKRLEDRDLLTMEDRIVLVETSTWQAPEDWQRVFERMMVAGYKPLFAHVERYRYLGEKDYETIHGMGVLMQLNYGSLTGFYGQSAFNKANDLLSKGWYSFCGSDCHRLHNIEDQYSAQCLKKSTVAALKTILK